jgi:hypothetical protein
LADPDLGIEQCAIDRSPRAGSTRLSTTAPGLAPAIASTAQQSSLLLCGQNAEVHPFGSLVVLGRSF